MISSLLAHSIFQFITRVKYHQPKRLLCMHTSNTPPIYRWKLHRKCVRQSILLPWGPESQVEFYTTIFFHTPYVVGIHSALSPTGSSLNDAEYYEKRKSITSQSNLTFETVWLKYRDWEFFGPFLYLPILLLPLSHHYNDQPHDC